MVSSSSLLLLFCSFTLFTNVIGRHNCQKKDDDFFAAQLVIFFTPKTTSVIRGQIAIYYYNPGYKTGDVISLSIESITGRFFSSNFYYPKDMKGIIFTNLAPIHLFYDGKSIYKHQCLGYTAEWLRNGTSMKSTCLSTHPDWMYEQRDILRNRKLSMTFIPGTHNSGSYSNVASQSIIEKFTVTQSLNITEQLIAGARYIDLRPACKKENDQPKYWVAHGSFFMNEMEGMINDIKTFLKNTHEIIILSFKEFPVGFDEAEDHLNFIQYLEKEFDGHLLPRSPQVWRITLREIWKSGTRLLVSYDNSMYLKSPKMWPRIPQLWGDIRPTSGLEALQSYLKTADANPTRPRVSMPEFTLDLMTIASHSIADTFGMEHTSLRRLGAIVGYNITQWYNEIFFENTTMVAVDFMDGTGIVEIALEWNGRRFSTCSDYFFNLMKKNKT